MPRGKENHNIQGFDATIIQSGNSLHFLYAPLVGKATFQNEELFRNPGRQRSAGSDIQQKRLGYPASMERTGSSIDGPGYRRLTLKTNHHLPNQDLQSRWQITCDDWGNQARSISLDKIFFGLENVSPTRVAKMLEQQVSPVNEITIDLVLRINQHQNRLQS